MKIGIMGAMPEEIDGIKDFFNFQLKNKLVVLLRKFAMTRASLL